MELFHKIPVIDIAALSTARSESELVELSKRFEEVYTKIGFSYIINHGISPWMVQQIFDQARQFHHSPLPEKMKIQQNEFFRGYMPFATSILKVSTLGEAVKPNQSAAFILGFDVDEYEPDFQARVNLAGPNQWPSENLLPDFKRVLLHYRESLTILARNLIRVFSLSLGQDYYALDDYFTQPTTFLRLQHYPPQPDVIPECQYGIAPHTDYGALTLLLQDSIGGLQVKQQDGSWLDVEPLPGAFVLNSGDMMRRLSNDTYISTPHRVINTSGKNRYSIPFFFEPNMHAVLSPVTSKNESILYPPIEYGSYLMKRIKNNYDINAQ